MMIIIMKKEDDDDDDDDDDENYLTLDAWISSNNLQIIHHHFTCKK